MKLMKIIRIFAANIFTKGTFTQIYNNIYVEG